MFAVVKETGVDDEGLVDFHNYFPYETYRDENLIFYEAFGNKKLWNLKMKSWNPFKIWAGMKEVGKRLEEKNIQQNMIGEGLILGGIILFGNDGEVKFSYVEDTGNDLPIDDLIAALNVIGSE